MSGHQLRNDRYSLELRAYLRSEWRDTPEWVRAPRRPFRPSALRRVRRWLRTRIAKPETRPAPTVRAVPVSDRRTAWSRSRESCPHLVADDLGSDLDAKFLRCSACGEILIVHQGRWWRIAATPSSTPPPSESDRAWAANVPEAVVDA